MTGHKHVRHEEHTVSAPDSHEGTAWWREAIDVADARGRAMQRSPEEPVVVSITPDRSPAERMCDHCGEREQRGRWFSTFAVERGHVMIVGALCEGCLILEGIEPPSEGTVVSNGN